MDRRTTGFGTPSPAFSSAPLGWLAILLLACLLGAHALPARSAEPGFSAPERAWLAAHRVVRLGIDAGYGPYTFVDEQGRLQGVVADLLAELRAITGIRFEIVSNLAWPELMAAVRERRLDAVATVVRLPEREDFLAFTAIYLPTPLVIMTRADAPQLRTLDDLKALRLALVEGYSSSRQIVERYPDLRPRYVAAPLDGLRALAVGGVDAYVGVLGVNTFLAQRHGISNLKVNAAFDMEQNGQRIGVRKDWPELAAILDKALAAIPDDRRGAIFNRWLPVQASKLTVLGQLSLMARVYPWLLSALGLALLGYLAFWFWNRQLKRQLARQRRELGAGQARLQAAETIAHLGHWEYLVADGKITWSDELYRIFGLAPQSQAVTYDQLIGWIHPDDRVAHDAYLARMLACQPGESIEAMDYRLSRADGQERHSHVQARVEFDPAGKPQRLFGTVQDITDLKHTEAEAKAAHARTRELLAEAEQARRALQQVVEEERRTKAALARENDRTQLILNTTLDGYVLADTAGQLLDVNPAYCQLVGYGREQLLGMNIRQLEAGMSDAEVEERIQAMQDVGHARFETVHHRRDGGLVDLDVNAAIMELDGKPLVAAFVRDISECKRAEHDLRQLNEELEHKVARRTAELSAANERLQELDRLKSMFIASMSHELRTPLNSIIGFTGMIIGDMAGPVSDKQRGYLERVYRSGKHLLALITDIIDISKIEAGMLAVEYETFPLRLAVVEAAGEVELDAAAKGLEIGLDVPADIDLRSDRRRLSQCLLNLLSNAVKYSERGRIEVSATIDAGWVEIAVRDTGIGIPAEDMVKLFQPFARLESALKIPAGGTGLGLYLTRKLAREVLGGEVSASSQAGLGSTFVLRVPLSLNPT